MTEIANCCKRRYRGKLSPYTSGQLYGLAYYFFRENLSLDADNLSKPIWDALNGVAYTDDGQIVTRVINAINLNENEISMIDFTGIDGRLLSDLVAAAYEEKHLVYVECGIVNKNMWKFNLENL